MDRLLGSKKYKGKLTERKRTQPEHLVKVTSKASSQKSQHSAAGSALSLEPLDLRSNFFAPDAPLKKPRGSKDDGLPNNMGIAKKDYAPVVEQSEFRHSEESNPSQSANIGRALSYGYSESHKRFDSLESALSEEDPPSPAPLRLPPHRIPYNRVDSYQYGYDTDNDHQLQGIPGTTPLESPTADDHMMVREDPFDQYFDAQTTPSPRHSPSPVPPRKSSARARFLAPPLYNTATYESIASEDIPQMMPEKKSKRNTFNSSYRHSVLKDQLAKMVYTEKRPKRQPSLPEYDDEEAAAEPLHKKGLRTAKKWYRGCSTRSIILIIVGCIAAVALAVGLTLGIFFRHRSSMEVGLTPTWRPSQGTTWNIQFSTPMNPVGTSALYAYNVYDIDLFDNNATTIAMLHKMGRRVICYFSAGTFESWRPDANLFPKSAIGNVMPNWEDEMWVDTRDKNIRAIMEARIDLAITKGCDGVDPDNVDGYSSNTSFPLTVETGVDYMKHLATYAHTKDIAIGLKNAPELINGTIDLVDWELNESCVQYNECDVFHPFIQAGKPVLHIEYTDTGANATLLHESCTAKGTHGFSTLIKRSKLDQWSMSCPIGDSSYGVDASI